MKAHQTYISSAILIISLILWSVATSSAQTNPFDMKYKLEKEKLEEALDNTPVDDSPSDSSPEVVPVPESDDTKKEGDEVEKALEGLSELESPVEDSNTIEVANELGVDSADKLRDESIRSESGRSGKHRPLFLFLMLIAATILTTMTISSNRNLVNNVLRAVLNDNYLNLMYREQKKSGASYYYILYFVFAVNAGLFLYFLLSSTLFDRGMPMLWKCVILIGIIYTVRHLFMQYLAYVYPFQKELEQYTFTILIFNIFLGLLLLPINVFIAFSPEPIYTFFLYTGLFVVLIVYIFRQLRGVFISNRLLFHNKFYFLLYLCAVEIAPMLLLVKYTGAYVS